MHHPHPPRPPWQSPRRELLASLRKALESSRTDVSGGTPENLPVVAPGNRPVVVLGVGSVLRSDDAVGIRVAERLAALTAERGLQGVRAVDGGPAPENMTAEIKQLSPSLVVIVDAASMGEPAGTIRVIDRAAVGGATFGTHGLPLTVLADYLRAEIGCGVIFVGVQPASAEHGQALSPAVEAAAEELTGALVECLG